MRDFYWCLREGCGSGQIHRPPRSRLCPDTLFVCHACNGKQCTQHAVKWHDGLSCKEYEKSNPRKLRQDKASKRAVEKESIYCPGCNSPVSKISGCSHMECKFRSCPVLRLSAPADPRAEFSPKSYGLARTSQYGLLMLTKT